jgi:hypothetical protein
LAVVGLAGAPLATAGEPGRAPGDTPQIIAFDNEEFLGDHIHVFGNMKDLGKWGNSISSMVILAVLAFFGLRWHVISRRQVLALKVVPHLDDSQRLGAQLGISRGTLTAVCSWWPALASGSNVQRSAFDQALRCLEPPPCQVLERGETGRRPGVIMDPRTEVEAAPIPWRQHHVLWMAALEKRRADL